ncbi:probable carboxypeptidase X1 [Anneissia japonica]|uniref:probable carboxypeptidase X1 n=1 Tax=Anneissia japonica TaxID=1529436 RepID=UPI0014255463|nr:probable carboxypeptidase X1 [Anneissia japonica]
MLSILTILVIFSLAKAIDGCDEYNVGLANTLVIPDSAFSASSECPQSGNYHGYRAARGRLDVIYEGPNKKGGWMADASQTSHWIDVDLQATVNVAGVITQGRQCGDDWVKEYRVEYKNSGTTYISVTNTMNLPMTFTGNTDRNTKVTNLFPKGPVLARNIRIHPTDWNRNAPSLRFEVIGCQQ